MMITKTDIEKGIRNEERNEAMNMMNSAQKANSKAFDKGYDQIRWGTVDYKEYWAYLCTNKQVYVRMYDPEGRIMDMAIESDAVVKVVGPFKAEDRAQATRIAGGLINAA